MANDTQTKPNHFILLGSAHHATLINHSERFDQIFWVVPKSAKKGDVAFIYLAAPVSRIVGQAKIVDEPFFHVTGRFTNKKMQNKQCAQIGEIKPFAEREELTMRGLRDLFDKDWRWLSYPRSHVRIPDSIIEPFLELFND